MGLDMYLNKKTYVKNWDHMKKEDKHKITVKKNGKLVKHIKPERIKYIVEEAGYWRKANAIHGWFVKNVQDGNDNCEEYYVDPENIEKLLDLIKEVLSKSELVKGKVRQGITFKNGKETPIMEKGKIIKDPLVAKKLLPVTSGFFFGNYDESTAYNEYYYQDLEDTKKILEKALADKEGKYYYCASW